MSVLRAFAPRTIAISMAITSWFPVSLVAGDPVPALPQPARHGFHADGRPWLWPMGAQALTPQERDGVFRRQLQAESAVWWTLDRGQADLEYIAGESRMDPNLLTSGIRVRVTYANGETQDFPARAVLGMDKSRPWGGVRNPDGMLIESILPSDGSIKRIQLFDHQGILAWDGEIKGSFFKGRPERSIPEQDKDHTPGPGYKVKLSSDQPVQGKIDSRVEARRELQNAYIKAGTYPPYEILLSEPVTAK